MILCFFKLFMNIFIYQFKRIQNWVNCFLLGNSFCILFKSINDQIVIFLITDCQQKIINTDIFIFLSNTIFISTETMYYKNVIKLKVELKLFYFLFIFTQRFYFSSDYRFLNISFEHIIRVSPLCPSIR